MRDRILRSVAEWMSVVAWMVFGVGVAIQAFWRHHTYLGYTVSLTGLMLDLGLKWSHQDRKARVIVMVLLILCLAIAPSATVLKLSPSVHWQAPASTELVPALIKSSAFLAAFLLGCAFSRFKAPVAPSTLERQDISNA